jgi:hypothetical protein
MKIKNRAALVSVIAALEDKREREKQGIVDSFHGITDSLRPLQLIKRAYHKVQLPAGLAGNVVKVISVVGIGFVSKKLLLGKSNGLIKKMAGLLIELGVADLLTKKKRTEAPIAAAVEKNATVEKEKV